MGQLATLFEPDRIAVVGATDREDSVGRAITANLLADFEGDVVAVNPTKDEVLGLESYDSVTAVSDVDVAVIVVPPPVVIEALREFETVWAAAGTPRAVFPVDPERIQTLSDATTATVAEE